MPSRALRSSVSSVAGPRPFDDARIFRCGLDLFRRHDLGPMHEIAVFDHQGDRRAERAAVTHAREKLDPVGLDLHPAAAPVALLPAPEFVIDLLGVDLHAGRQAFDDRDECLAVRFAGGCESELHRHHSTAAGA